MKPFCSRSMPVLAPRRWPWSPGVMSSEPPLCACSFKAQDSHYRQRYPDADFKLILVDNNPVGRIYVFRDEQKLRILDITVLPGHHNSGIGSAEIKQ